MTRSPSSSSAPRWLRALSLLALSSLALGCGPSAPPIESAASAERARATASEADPDLECNWTTLPVRYLFPAASAELDAVPERPNQDRMLAELVDVFFQRERVRRIRVSGFYTPECRYEWVNGRELADARGRAVAARLIELGVPAEIVEVRNPYPGSPMPTHPICDPERVHIGRRVLFAIYVCE